MFGLLVPEKSTEEHLKLLRRLAELFSENQTLAELRDASDDEKVYKTLIARDTSDA